MCKNKKISISVCLLLSLLFFVMIIFSGCDFSVNEYKIIYENDNDYIVSGSLILNKSNNTFSLNVESVNEKNPNTYRYSYEYTGIYIIDENNFFHIIFKSNDDKNYYNFIFDEEEKIYIQDEKIHFEFNDTTYVFGK